VLTAKPGLTHPQEKRLCINDSIAFSDPSTLAPNLARLVGFSSRGEELKSDEEYIIVVGYFSALFKK
jgi:hypothetical protein